MTPRPNDIWSNCIVLEVRPYEGHLRTHFTHYVTTTCDYTKSKTITYLIHERDYAPDRRTAA